MSPLAGMKPNVGANISPVATLTGVHAFPNRWAAWTVAPSIFTVKVFFLSGSVGHWRNGGGLAARFHTTPKDLGSVYCLHFNCKYTSTQKCCKM
jgi:hypothetical protein